MIYAVLQVQVGGATSISWMVYAIRKMIREAVVWVNAYTPPEISIGPSEEGKAQDTDMWKMYPQTIF